MSRGLSATNVTHVEGDNVHEVILVNLQLATPVYVHSGIGTIVYDSNSYLGVGDFGTIDKARESQKLGPSPVTLELSGIDSTLLSEALDSTNYGAAVTILIGYRSDDGTLIADPWTVFKGTYDHALLVRGADNAIRVIVQHVLSAINETDGRRFSDEDQQAEYTGDTGFEYVTGAAFEKLIWGGRPTPRQGASPGISEPATDFQVQ